MEFMSTPTTWAGGGYPWTAGLSASRPGRSYRVEMASTLRAPRCSAGERGAVRRTPPSPYQASSMRTAGKKRGSAAEAMMCSTVMLDLRAVRWGRSHSRISDPSTHVTDCPVE